MFLSLLSRFIGVINNQIMGRAFHHDYTKKCIYHITLKKRPGIPDFGELAGTLPDVFIRRSMLGNVIADNIATIPWLNPNFRVIQYKIMPDHVHLLWHVTAPIDRHLGNYIAAFKVGIDRNYHKHTNPKASLESIFEDDFYDCILYKSRSLDAVVRYIKDNPYRLAVRKARPEYFQRIDNLIINGKTFQTYGNIQLLSNPFKDCVVVHRSDDEYTRMRHRNLWLYGAENGGVLVSPFISGAEKKIRDEAEASGGRFIIITAEPFTDRYKPAVHNFELCASGRLLLVSAADILGSVGDRLTREQCLAMNELALQISRYQQIGRR